MSNWLIGHERLISDLKLLYLKYNTNINISLFSAEKIDSFTFNGENFILEGKEADLIFKMYLINLFNAVGSILIRVQKCEDIKLGELTLPFDHVYGIKFVSNKYIWLSDVELKACYDEIPELTFFKTFRR